MTPRDLGRLAEAADLVGDALAIAALVALAFAWTIAAVRLVGGEG